MALKSEIKEKLKSVFGIDPDTLETAIRATEEVDFALPEDVTVIKNTELQARDAAKVVEGKKIGEPEGEKKGKELAAKSFRKKFNLPDEIGVDVDKITEAITTKLATGDKGLQEQIQALLKDKETLISERDTAIGSAKQTQFEANLVSMFPAKRTEGLKDSERLLIMKNDLQFVEENGVVVVKKNGAAVTHPTTHAPLPINEVINSYFAERKWIAEESGAGGRGGGNAGSTSAKAGIKTMTSFVEKWKAENPGKTELAPEFMTAINEHAKEVKDFNWGE